MNNNKIYPWHYDVWQRLVQNRGRLPHALLLQGKAGAGKFDFALQLTKALLCQAPQTDGVACDRCSSCHWFEQNSHPDYRLLTPEQESVNAEDDVPAKKTTKKTQISVNQIRELSHFLELSSHRNEALRIAIVHPAEALNIASANALLKMLEEPPKGMVFILVSHQPQRLLPTIISRCHKVDMPLPSSDLALSWLKQLGVEQSASTLAYVGGSPLAALGDAELGAIDINSIVKELARGNLSDNFYATSLLLPYGMVNALNIMQKWVYDILTCKLAGEVRYHITHLVTLQALCKRVDLSNLLDFQRKLDEAKRSATHPLNHELQLEQLLLNYRKVFN